jgi:ATP-dependent DNA helicase RecQ
MILSCVVRLGERRGAQYTAWVLRGDTTKDVALQDHGLSTFGLLAAETDRDIRRWIEECVAQGLLARSDGQYPVLRVSPEGWDVLHRRREAQLSPPGHARPRGKAKQDRESARRERRRRADADLSGDSAALFEELRRARMALARAQGVPP